jgi:glycerophosphoryl diester phosphodiesterase
VRRSTLVAPITFAHRGGRGDRPENTMTAFRDALARGCSGLESDVHVAGDGVAMLVHDPVIRRGLRRVRVASTPAAALSELGIPSLADLYAELGTDYDLSLDAKGPGSGPAMLRVAQAMGDGAVERLWICTADVEELEQLRAESPAVRLVHSVRRRVLGTDLERHAARLAAARVDALNMHRSDWSLGLVALFHRFGVRAFAWDVQEVRQLRDVLAMEIDAVYSDWVDRMVATVAEWRGA